MKQTDKEIMSDFDEDKYADKFCREQNCRLCYGTDFNGEPNGYGCTAQDEYISKWFNSILYRRKKKLKQLQEDGDELLADSGW